MTDKEKLREEVEKLKSQLLRGACSSQIAMETMCKEEAYNEVLAILDSVQEEPASDDLEEASKEWLKPQLDKSYADYGEVKMMELTHFDGYAMLDAIEFGAKWQKEKDSIVMMANSADAMIGLPYENKDGGYTHLIDVSRPLPVGNNKIAIIFKED